MRQSLSASTSRWMWGLTLPILLTLAGCQADSTPAPATEIPNTSSPEVLPAQTAAPTQAEASPATEAPEPTNPPTLTPTLMSTPYTIGEFPITQKGPWLLFVAREPGSIEAGGLWCENTYYLWAANQDGTWLTRLEHEPVSEFALKPGSTSEDGAAVAYTAGSSLKIMELPSGTITTVAQSASSFKWSPGGSLLAFVSPLDDDTGDMYIYDYASRAITRLSAQHDPVTSLYWSPDGAYLVYQAGDDLWSVESDGSNPLLLEETGFSQLYGWLDEATIIFLTKIESGPYSLGIHLVSVDTGDSTSVAEGPFLDAAYSKEHNTWLLAQSYDPKPDIPLLLYQYGKRTEIPGYAIDSVWWSSEYDVFFGQSEDGALYTITPDGETTRLSDSVWVRGPFTPSPDARWWAWSEIDHTAPTDYAAAGAAWHQPVNIAVGQALIWSLDSQYLIVLDEGGLHFTEPPSFQAGHTLGYVCDMFLGTERHRINWQATWIP